MRGYLANFFSLQKKINMAMPPKTSRHITFGELHGKDLPPKSRPSKSISVTARIERHPAQSMAFIPSQSLVFGLCTSKKSSRSTKVVPQIAASVHQHQPSNVPHAVDVHTQVYPTTIRVSVVLMLSNMRLTRSNAMRLSLQRCLPIQGQCHLRKPT